MDVIKLCIPDSWFKHVIGFSNKKGIGFEVSGMRAWFKDSSISGYKLITFEYKNKETNRWKMFYRTLSRDDLLYLSIETAKNKLACGCSACLNYKGGAI